MTRLAEALDDDARLFTAAEVRFVLRAAEAYGRSHSGAAALWRAGYEKGLQRGAEATNEGYPPPSYLVVAGVAVRRSQADARAEADADRTERWAGGGADAAMAAFMWDADRPEPDHGPSARHWHPRAGVPVTVERGVMTWA